MFVDTLHVVGKGQENDFQSGKIINNMFFIALFLQLLSLIGSLASWIVVGIYAVIAQGVHATDS